MSTRRYQTFLSHSSDDKDFVRHVAARLQSESISFFLDEAALVPGTPWQDAIESAIADSDSCVVFLGPDGMGPWHKLEMRAALSEQIEKNRGFRVIPVLLPSTQKPNDDLIPSFLRQLTWVVFRGDPRQDQEAFRRLRCGILGEEPGFTPPASATALTFPSDLTIVPRGLRSYEPEDHPFFLRLVPGVRDESGLPRVIRDWKKLIERVDPRRTFNVAYWYGPSGCGKSSLLKAGLLPTLAEYVVTVLVSASPASTESEVLRELHRVVTSIPRELNLSAAFAWLAEHPEALAGQTLLVVLDQFEQWLHARRGQLEGELAAALRHCNGHHLQALLLVRDDFTVAVHRFMTTLGCELREHFNCQLVDLFAPEFAERVLFEYGRSYERLPEHATDLSDDQSRFLEQLVQELTNNDEKVAPVHLALLAQMLANKPWTRASLRTIGGAAGIGRAFLEETFEGRSSNAIGRIHREAAAKLLEALLPETGSLIKGRQRTRDELIEVTGYKSRPNDFEELINFLDHELRIITPVSTDDVPCYQLTHDYLVPSLRDWLTAKQRKTWRGRAMLVLAERTTEWTAKPGVRSLPGPLEYLRILTAVLLPTWRLRRPPQKPSSQQRRALWASTRWYAMAGSLLAAVLLALGAWRWELNGRDAAQQLANHLNRTTDPKEHRALVDGQLSAYRRWVVPELHRRIKAKPGTGWNDAVRSESGQRRADEAVALLQLGALDEARAAFQWHAHGDPEAQTQFIHRAKDHGITAEQLVRLYERATFEGDVDTRLAALLALGTFSSAEVATDHREAFAGRMTLADVYASDPSSAIHSASGWLLRTWGLRVPSLEPTAAARNERDWMVIRVPSNDLQGPPIDLTFVRIPRSTAPTLRLENKERFDADFPLEVADEFWLSAHEVTVALFRRFHDEVKDPNSSYRQQHADEFPTDWKWESEDKAVSPTADHPIQQASWEDAVLLCNWLSRRTNRQPCYRRSSGKWERVAKGEAYRLPTEREWEYACRAGSVAQYGFGSEPRLLAAYAVYFNVTAQPVGSRLPNAWGVHDMHGNLVEWCEDWHAEDEDRVNRGGSWFDDSARNCRSARRGRNMPAFRVGWLGFRVALVPSRQELSSHGDDGRKK